MNTIINSLAGGLPAGFFLGACLYFIIRHYSKSKLFKFWQSFLLTWLVMSIFIYLYPNYSENKVYQLVFTFLIIFGFISAFKIYKK